VPDLHWNGLVNHTGCAGVLETFEAYDVICGLVPLYRCNARTPLSEAPSTLPACLLNRRRESVGRQDRVLRKESSPIPGEGRMPYFSGTRLASVFRAASDTKIRCVYC
jgi:hypothetical protein